MKVANGFLIRTHIAKDENEVITIKLDKDSKGILSLGRVEVKQ